MDTIENNDKATLTIPFNFKAVLALLFIASGIGAGTGVAQLREQPKAHGPVVIDSSAAGEIARAMSDALKESQRGVQAQLQIMQAQSVANDEWCQRMTDKLVATMKSIDNTLIFMGERLDRMEKTKG